MNLAHIVPRLVDRDPTAPALTYYNDSSGERIEVSARVLSMWASKASHWLTDEMLVDAGGRVLPDLPPRHWRSIYWTFAVWSIGAEIRTSGGPDSVDAVVAMAPGSGDIVEPEASLAMSQLTAFPDRFGAIVDAAPHDLAMDGRTYADLSSSFACADGERVMLVDTDLPETLRLVACVLASGGSVVLVRSEDETRRAARMADEGVDRVVG